MKSKRKKQQGFTLVEVLAVIAIIAILGLIAVPSVLNTIKNSKNSSYSLMINDIKVALQELFEEVEYLGSNSTLYVYNSNGKTGNRVTITEEAEAKRISLNLQTLVSNGFLSGTNNENPASGSNKNTKVLLDPRNNNDLGECQVEISKKVNDKGKVTYQIISINETTNSLCPSTGLYQE